MPDHLVFTRLDGIQAIDRRREVIRIPIVPLARARRGNQPRIVEWAILSLPAINRREVAPEEGADPQPITLDGCSKWPGAPAHQLAHILHSLSDLLRDVRRILHLLTVRRIFV